MLYVFHGSNTTKGVTKAHSLIRSLRDKKPDATFISVDADHFSSAAIEEHLGGQGLFSNKYIVYLDRVTENNPEANDIFIDLIPAMKESANIFIVLEGKVNAELKKNLEKHADKFVVCEDAGAGPSFKKKEFNIFALSDAFASRDALRTWNLYRQAIDRETGLENILGSLFWQMKSLKLASRATTPAEAGLSPFVFSNCKRLSKKYSSQEIDQMINKLLIIYHDGHRGVFDQELELERVILSL